MLVHLVHISSTKNNLPDQDNEIKENGSIIMIQKYTDAVSNIYTYPSNSAQVPHLVKVK